MNAPLQVNATSIRYMRSGNALRLLSEKVVYLNQLTNTKLQQLHPEISLPPMGSDSEIGCTSPRDGSVAGGGASESDAPASEEENDSNERWCTSDGEKS